ncbi:radical SAM protein [Desulfogranum mediterraneum]|uniref:radical SAM protein n=1 Tax=Desulfogranum mediterraneum TaxID=160661 RepID=UPI00042584D0|nr:radical SAM protein [Desulfogranum mediterraneum]
MNNSRSKDYLRHPCFNAEAKGMFGRVHLPVAPKCNIKCNFCDRKYDCVNESRPGVTSQVLSPEQAGVYMQRVLEKEPRITVTGIAGPGDPFANPEETLATMRLIKKIHPEQLLCLSSNGLNIGPYIEELAEVEVSHVTITVCAVDPEVGREIYSWVKDGKVVYHGLQAAELLLSRQLTAIRRLKEHQITVKVNCIVIPGVNDHHLEEIARTMQGLGVDLFNCIAMFPNINTPFGHLGQPAAETMEEIRTMAEQYLPQMRHCTRCRADAVGLLDEDRTAEFRSCLSACSALKPMSAVQRPYVAVASLEGVLVNQHLGEARSFQVWEATAEGYRQLEERPAAEASGGIKRWHQLARILGDCRAVLVSGVGETPSAVLSASGIKAVEASGFIEEGLESIYHHKDTSRLKGRRNPCSEGSCVGGGGGCG